MSFDIVLDPHSKPVLVCLQPEGGVANTPVPLFSELPAPDTSPAAEEAEPKTLVEWTTEWLKTRRDDESPTDPSTKQAEVSTQKGEVMEWGAGAICRRTGVHRVTHHQHRPAHQAIVQEGEKFPPCRKCGTLVSFHFLQPLELSRETEHIGYDRDFMEWEWGLASGEAS